MAADAISVLFCTPIPRGTFLIFPGALRVRAAVIRAFRDVLVRRGGGESWERRKEERGDTSSVHNAPVVDGDEDDDDHEHDHDDADFVSLSTWSWQLLSEPPRVMAVADVAPGMVAADSKRRRRRGRLSPGGCEAITTRVSRVHGSYV